MNTPELLSEIDKLLADSPILKAPSADDPRSTVKLRSALATRSKTPPRRSSPHPPSSTELTLSQTSSRIITAAEDGAARIWRSDASNAQDGSRRYVYERTFETPFDGILSAPVFDRDLGPMLFTVCAARSVQLWDISTDRCIAHFHGHSKGVQSAALNPQGSMPSLPRRTSLVATSSTDHTAKIWDVASSECARTLHGHSQGLLSAVFSPSSAFVLTGSTDCTAKLWDVESGSCLRTLRGHARDVRSCSFSQGDMSRLVLTASRDASVMVWCLETSRRVACFTGHTDAVHSAELSPDASKVVSSSSDCCAKLWSLRTGICTQTLRGHEGPVRSAAFSADGRRVLTASDDETARLWDAQSGECLQVLAGHCGAVIAAQFEPQEYGFSAPCPTSEHTIRRRVSPQRR